MTKLFPIERERAPVDEGRIAAKRGGAESPADLSVYEETLYRQPLANSLAQFAQQGFAVGILPLVSLF